MDKTIKYYQDCFGMKLLRFRDIPEARAARAVGGAVTGQRQGSSGLGGVLARQGGALNTSSRPPSPSLSSFRRL